MAEEAAAGLDRVWPAPALLLNGMAVAMPGVAVVLGRPATAAGLAVATFVVPIGTLEIRGAEGSAVDGPESVGDADGAATAISVAAGICGVVLIGPDVGAAAMPALAGGTAALAVGIDAEAGGEMVGPIVFDAAGSAVDAVGAIGAGPALPTGMGAPVIAGAAMGPTAGALGAAMAVTGNGSIFAAEEGAGTRPAAGASDRAPTTIGGAMVPVAGALGVLVATDGARLGATGTGTESADEVGTGTASAAESLGRVMATVPGGRTNCGTLAGATLSAALADGGAAEASCWADAAAAEKAGSAESAAAGVAGAAAGLARLPTASTLEGALANARALSPERAGAAAEGATASGLATAADAA